MRKSKFTIVYKNGKEKELTATSFKDAIIAGMHHANLMGWDDEIDFVKDMKYGIIVDNINVEVNFRNTAYLKQR